MKNKQKLYDLFLKTMKISLIQAIYLMAFAGISVAHEGKSQELLDQRVTLTCQHQAIEVILKKIEKMADVRFLYSHELIKADRKATFKVRNEKLLMVLDELFKPLHISYEISGRQIILKRLSSSLLSEAGESFARSAPVAFTVTGRVTSETEGLPGVSVLLKGTTIGTSTDSEGKYTLSLSSEQANGTLVFSFIGYNPQTVAIANRTVIDVVLTPDAETLSEVVVVGYGTQKKSDVTGSISSIKADELKTQGSNSIQKSLQGRAAGVQVESAGGEPGAGVMIQIRGTGSLTNNVPLYIVDGVQVDNINNLNPSDVESMDILKDASAAAIYGSRAANGVVLITTKSGKKGDIKVNLDSYLGFQKIGKTLKVLNASQWATVSNAAQAAAGLPGLDIAKNPQALGEGTDWQKELYQTAPMQSHAISASGGGETYTFAVSAGYLKQAGTVRTTDYERFNLRLKSDFTKGRFKIGESIILSRENQTPLGQTFITSNGGGNAVSSAPRMIPAFQVYDAGAVGGYGGAYGNVVNLANPLAAVNLDIPENKTNNIIINLFAEVSLLTGLKYRYNTGYTNTANHFMEYAYPYQIGSSQVRQYLYQSEISRMQESRTQTDYILQEHTLNYEKTLDKHSFNALAGLTYQHTKTQLLYGGKNGMPPGLKALDAGTTAASIGSNSLESALFSYLGRIVYSYDNRYVLTGTIRRDASSRFGKDYRYGVFPSLAAGWNVSNESFFTPLQSIISSMKLRASYGVLGNQNIPDYLYSPVVTPGLNYVLGQTPALWSGASQTAFATPNIRWETSKTFDVGAEWGFLNNKLHLTADYFIKKNTDVLLRVPVPLSTGASTPSPFVNAGQISNRGLEVALDFTHSAGDFTYQVNATATTIKNQVDKLGTGDQKIFGGQPVQSGASATSTQAGHSVGEFYLIQTAGIFQTLDEINAYTKDGKLIQPNAKPGDMKFIDANADGIISQNDRQYVGSAFPKLSYGFGGNIAWKGLDMSLFFQGTQGNKIYNGFRQDMEGMRLLANYAETTLNAWTPQNTQTDMPRAVANDPNFNAQTSTRFLENGSYLRLKTLQVGYSLPKNLLSTIKISNCRFYVSFDNLVTFTGYKGYNPDLGRATVLDRGVDFTNVAYPLARTSLLGVQVSF